MSDTGPSSKNSSSDPDATEMEIVNDFSDLNLEIVSGSQMPSISNEDAPSIDDFEFVADNTPSKGPAKDRDAWYTNVLGQDLGPFPFEKLVEMVVDGEIGEDDYLRHGTDSPWMAAREIEGLFSVSAAFASDAPPEAVNSGEEDDDDFELGVQIDQEMRFTPPGKSGGGFQGVGGEINRASAPRPARPAPPPVQPPVLSPATPAPAAPRPTPVPQPAAPVLSKEEREAARKQAIASKLSAWLDDKVKTPEIDAELLEENPEEASLQDSGTVPSYSAAVGAAQSPQPPGARPENPYANAYGTPAAQSGYGQGGYGQPGYGQAAPAYTPPKFSPPKIKKSSSGGSAFGGLGNLFGGMSAPDVAVDPKIFIVLGVIAAVFGLMYLPGYLGGTNDMAIYKRFNEIHGMLEQARAGGGAQLSSVGPVLVAEVEKTIDDLMKSGAGASKPAKQQLMWAGRNCLLPLLKSPTPQSGPLDDRFRTHMTMAGRILGDDSIPPAPPAQESIDPATGTVD